MKELDTYLDLCTQVYELSKPKVPEADYNFYKSYLQDAKGKILEPMCGTGRFLLPFLQDGFDIQGFDASHNMLNSLNEKAKQLGVSPTVWHGYVEQVKQDSSFSLSFIPSGSFGLLIDESVANNALKSFYNILDSGGVLVFEAETLKAIPEKFGVPRSSVYKKNDGSMILATFFDVPPENNVGTSICRYELVIGNQTTQTEIEEFKVRMYDPEKLVKTLKNIGFSNVTLRKCFDRGLSPDDTDEVVVYECRK